MKKADFEAIKKNYPTLIFDNDDAQEAINFVRDLIDAEVEWTAENEPQATRYIAEMDEASRRIGSLLEDIEGLEDEE